MEHDLSVLLAPITGLAISATDVKPKHVTRWQNSHIMAQLPDAYMAHPVLADLITGARTRATHEARQINFEMARLERALSDTSVTPMILKGGAYLLAGDMAGQGRRLSDLDILVKQSDLHKVEAALLASEFEPHPDSVSDYDQQYYRQQMHELPPFIHKHRRTIIDVHHALVPPKARVKIDINAVWQAAEPVAGRRLMVPSIQDRIIHAAIHAYYDGTLDYPLRHLMDISRLLVSYGTCADNLKRLQVRADFLGCGKAFDQAISVVRWLSSLRAHKTATQHNILTMLVRRSLGAGLSADVAKSLSYVRGHYLRMPLSDLMRHMIAKIVARS